MTGCDIVPTGYLDPDGDGFAWPEDCDGERADVYPGAEEGWYDGVDQDCGGEDDYDQDGDGWVPAEHEGLATVGVPGSGGLPGGDCWDDPTTLPKAFEVIPSDLTDAAGQPLAWEQPVAAQVNPGAEELWYDGIDQDCDGGNDLDQDGDGFLTQAYPNRGGDFGDDCVDGAPLDEVNPAGTDPSLVNPAATETWYDGTDQDCDGDDCDQDGDGFDGGDGEYCTPAECDDTDASIYPTAEPELVWYDGIDDNCDGNDGDQDGDGFWTSDYEQRVLASGSGMEPLAIPTGAEGDCWDVPISVEGIPDAYAPVNDFEQSTPEQVFPGQTETWYDGVDQDCADDDDFDQDADGYTSDSWPDRDSALGGDCDDGNAAVHPGQIEGYYDGVDDSCEGRDGDADSDGYWVEGYVALVEASGGVPMVVPTDCGDDGLTDCSGDCDDTDAAVHPHRLEDCSTTADDDCDGDTNFDDDPGDATGCTVYYLDNDGDGYGTTAGDCTCAPVGAYSGLDGDDCDDTDPATWPGADEHCDGYDDDCDGLVDEDDAVDTSTWYADDDGDGYGSASATQASCAQPDGYVVDSTDCDDGDSGIHPGADEYCDGDDHDCDGLVNEDHSIDGITFYDDLDGDGYGDSTSSTTACTQPSDASLNSTDCDDGDATIHQGADEYCDGVDHDCDGEVNDDHALDASTWYTDADGDGYGDAAGPLTACSLPSGASADDTDCDDSRAASNPAAPEYCSGYDDDCDGTTDESSAIDATTWYEDADGDGYGTASATQLACYQPSGTAALATDCDDSRAESNPGATEYCNGYDDDCDGSTDEATAADASTWYIDYDRDGYGSSTYTATSCSVPSGYTDDESDCDDTDATVYPEAPEICGDGVVNDCDGDWFDDCGWVGDIDLSAADAIILGEAYYDNAGYSLAVGGDFDRDGLADLAVGAMDGDYAGTDSGAVYVLQGPAAAATTNVSSASAKLVGEDAGDYAGTSVAWVGDMDADGYDDLLVGSQAGRAYLVLGPVVGELGLGSSDAELYGSSSDMVGYAVAYAGDVDSDGYDDLLVGSLDDEAYLWYGPVYGTESSSGADVRFDADHSGDDVGTALASGGDVDGDGLNDVLVGAPGNDDAGSSAGAAYLVLAPFSSTERLRNADVIMQGESSHDDAGLSVALAGDVDGDGLPDLLVGAPGDDDGGSSAGAVYLVTAPSLGTWSLSSAIAKFWGEAAGDYAGFSVASAGDVDDDGLADFLVGAPLEASGGAEAGAAYLILGASSGGVELSSAVATFIGESGGDGAGYSIVGGEDLDGDGLPELLVGAPWQDSEDDNAGAVYLFEGGGV